MLVSDIIDEVKEISGKCSDSDAFRLITRAVEMLANTKLIDPLIGTIEIAATDRIWIALPRDVKTPLRINVNGNPSFARSRLFEFTQNTEGSNDEESIGWSWANRGYLPIQDETKLPGHLKYSVSNPADEGKTVFIKGRGADGLEITETLTGLVSPTASTNIFYQIEQIRRDETQASCTLYCEGDAIARYYPDETSPQYRVIKLSKQCDFARILFRRSTFKVTSVEDIIPMDSGLALIHACNYLRFLKEEDFEKAAAAKAAAEEFLIKEQASRDEADQLSSLIEVPSSTDQIIANRDGIVVADIYDMACEIFGGIGQRKIFDKITAAHEILGNVGRWDRMVGAVDLFKDAGTDGYFVLPRFIEGIISININRHQQEPRNRWFEFNLNGPMEREVSSFGMFDDMPETPIIAKIPVDSDKKPVAQYVACLSSLTDEDKKVRVFGYDENGRWIIEDGEDGFEVLNKQTLTPSAQKVTRIERITRDATTSSVRLVTVVDSQQALTLGYWYPDETEPKYRAIKIRRKDAVRIRVLYRIRTFKVSSMFQPLHLRSRSAMECAMRAVLASSDPAMAANHLSMAKQYLKDEMRTTNPNKTGALQFSRGSMPSVTFNVQ